MASERGRTGMAGAHEMQRDRGRLNVLFQRLGSVPGKFPNPLNRKTKRNLDGERTILELERDGSEVTFQEVFHVQPLAVGCPSYSSLSHCLVTHSP